MTDLAALLHRLADGADARMTVPASEEELRRVDEALARPLPAPLRSLLLEVGSGLYEGGHEIFGPLRLMLHDIELVPDLLSVRARLTAEGLLHPHFLPFHRGGATFHLIRTEGAGAGCVVSLPAGRVYADLASFIEQVLLRAHGGADPRPPKASTSGGNDMLKTTVATIVTAAAVLGAAGSASATIAMQKKAKEAGLEAQNCLYCHGEKLPKKGASTYNERGEWLRAQKEKRQAKEIDAAWLKEYKEKKK
jgi:SMI1/KNR4 family protein SUKH-1